MSKCADWNNVEKEQETETNSVIWVSLATQTHAHSHTHTYTHTEYFAASTVQTALNIRQKLAIWDNKHKLYGPQQQKKMGC